MKDTPREFAVTLAHFIILLEFVWSYPESLSCAYKKLWGAKQSGLLESTVITYSYTYIRKDIQLPTPHFRFHGCHKCAQTISSPPIIIILRIQESLLFPFCYIIGKFCVVYITKIYLRAHKAVRDRLLYASLPHFVVLCSSGEKNWKRTFFVVGFAPFIYV